MTKDHRMTDEERAQIKSLMALGFSPTAIGKRLDRDHKTIIVYTKKPETITEIAELKEDLADSFEGLARRMVDSITDEDIQKINAYQRTVASGIAFDKVRLLRGQSTENIDLSITGLIAKITANSGGLIGNNGPVDDPVIEAQWRHIDQTGTTEGWLLQASALDMIPMLAEEAKDRQKAAGVAHSANLKHQDNRVTPEPEEADTHKSGEAVQQAADYPLQMASARKDQVMGWASGSRLMEEAIQAISSNVVATEARKAIYLRLIPAFEDADCDTLDECRKIDDAFDAALDELNPREDED